MERRLGEAQWLAESTEILNDFRFGRVIAFGRQYENTPTTSLPINAHAFINQAGYGTMSGLMPHLVLLMKKKTFRFGFLLSMLALSSALGQSPSPSTNPKSASPAPQASIAPESAATTPVVRVRIVVRCDEAAIRTSVETSLRTELAKLQGVTVLSGAGASHLIVGVKLVQVQGVQVKSPLYATEVSVFDTPALYNALETVGLSRQTIYTLLVANEVQPIRDDNVLTVVSKDNIPTKVATLIPLIEQHGVQHARLAITMNQQRKPGAAIETNSVREDVP